MEKISGILPSSARIKSVDLNASGSARPGGPSFGRPVGRSVPSSRGLTTAQKAMNEFNSMERMNPVVDHKVKIIQDMTDSFFMKKKIQPEDINLNDPAYQLPEVNGPAVDQAALMEGIVRTEDPVTVDYALEAVNVMQNEMDPQEAELDQPLTGSNLDVRV